MSSLSPLELFEKHRGLVSTILRRMSATKFARASGLERDDIEQEALRGLWLASLRYRVDGGASFSRYAWLTIQGTVLDHVNRYNYSGSKAAGCNFSHRQKLKSLCMTNDEGEVEQVDFASPEDTFETVCRNEKVSAVQDAVEALQPDRSEAVREHRLKFRILKDVAEESGCSRERIRQRMKKGLDTLKGDRYLVALAAD